MSEITYNEYRNESPEFIKVTILNRIRAHLQYPRTSTSLLSDIAIYVQIDWPNYLLLFPPLSAASTLAMAFTTASAGQRLLASPKASVPKRPNLRPPHPNRSNSIAEKTAGVLLGGLLGVSLATAFPAALTPPAKAGVVIKQPERKSVFYGTEEPKKKKSQPAPSSSGGGPISLPNFGDAGILALPVSIAGIAGVTVVGGKLDTGLDGFLKATLIKNNNEEGAGYEVKLKTINEGKKK